MYDKEKLYNILTNDKYKTVNDDCKIFPPSYNVYCLISEALQNNGSHITPKHIYTILKNDRSGMYTAELKAFCIDKKSIFDKSNDSSFNVTGLNNTLSSTSETMKRFQLVISEEKWAQIKPTRQTYGRNRQKYMSLQPGKWTHVFADKIWQQTKLPCAFSFKRANVFTNRDAKCYAKFKGTCNDCGAQLVGILYIISLQKRAMLCFIAHLLVFLRKLYIKRKDT